MDNIRIQEWDEEQFKNSQSPWNKLLERSDSDPLFMSWEWMYTWWETFANDDMKLQLLAAIDEQGNLVGLAPFYIAKATSKKFIVTRRLQFIGNCWRGKTTMRTELLDFIAHKSISKQVIRAFYIYLNELSNWDELVLSDLKINSETYQILTQERLIPKCYYRITEEFDSFYIDTMVSFDEYTKQLGKNTRLRLFNRRKILEQINGFSFRINQNNDIKKQFKLLNTLHAQRWGAPVFRGIRLRFNETLAARLSQKGALAFSTLCIEDMPVSIQYNYVINNHKYNIQAGFDEKFHKKLALGYLHFGYEIEHACNSEIKAYDMLAGDGKNTSYKEHLTQSRVRITNIQIIRKPVAKIVYKLYDYYTRLAT